MSLHFVTAKQGSAHISSIDWRSLNKGILGGGKYFIENTSGDFEVNAATGEITIPKKSFIWSGGHIRNDSDYVVNYVPPTSTSTINLWFHYSKDVSTGVETLTLETTIDSQPTPISDVIEDTTMEAYTLVYSFVHNAESLMAENQQVYFESIKSIEELEEALKLSVQAISAEKNERLESEQQFNKRLKTAEDIVSKVRGSEVLMSYRKIAPTNAGVKLDIGSHPFNAFSFLVVGFSPAGSSTKNGHYAIVPVCKGYFNHIQTLIEDVSLSSANKITQLWHQFEIGEDTSGNLTLTYSTGNHGNDDYTSKFWCANAVYGIY